MPEPPSASVIIRAKDAAATIEAAFRSLREQTIPCEIVVVDSGSADGTRALAARWADQVVDLDPRRFSYGAALNVGARVAAGDVHFALSSHVVAPRADWLERSLAHYERPDVAGTSGSLWQPDGSPLLDPVTLTAQSIRAHPGWGFSNTASSWRASVWTSCPFDERMVACEDKEWSWRVARAGWDIVVDPRLAVADHHRRRAGVRALVDRTRRERREIAARVPLPPFPLGAAVGAWWSDFPDHGTYPALFYRLNYLRLAEIAGRWLGEREGRRLRA